MNKNIREVYFEMGSLSGKIIWLCFGVGKGVSCVVYPLSDCK